MNTQGTTNGFPLKIEVLVKEEIEAEFHAGASRVLREGQPSYGVRPKTPVDARSYGPCA
jgi:hypothetical protein